jgi:putative addiction module component (TIGR02574 family)
MPRYDGMMNPGLLDEARRLSVGDRIELVAAIWDTVAEDANTAALPVSDSHRLELNRRLEDRQKNPSAESAWSEVADRLSKR